jgi:HK97 family phage portal protein
MAKRAPAKGGTGLSQLRSLYRELANRPADKSWGVARLKTEIKSLSPVDNRGSWFPIIREFLPGSFQAGVEVKVEDVLQYWAVFRCVSIIASDIAKMRLKLVEKNRRTGIWSETEDARISRLLEEPNPTQTRLQFFENWMTSKLVRGNTYVLKRRDDQDNVVALYILDPDRTTPMIADDGSVFYQLSRDNYVGITLTQLLVPAEDIIHDRWNCLFHPMVGLSPIYAHAINAMGGLKIGQNSARFFANGARPNGVLTAPGAIGNDTAARMKADFESEYGGANVGRTMVAGDGITYTPMTMSAVDAQMIEQLRWNDSIIAGCYGVPAYMINAGPAPAQQNVEALQQMYYSQALQSHVEAIEGLLDKGLGLTEMTGRRIGTEFETDDLLRMDTATKVRTLVEGLKGVYTPNEARARLDLPPIAGGDAAYLQQQNFSLPALAKRDAKEDPFATAPAPAPADEPAETEESETPPEPANDNLAAEAAKALNIIRMGLAV